MLRGIAAGTPGRSRRRRCRARARRWPTSARSSPSLRRFSARAARGGRSEPWCAATRPSGIRSFRSRASRSAARRLCGEDEGRAVRLDQLGDLLQRRLPDGVVARRRQEVVHRRDHLKVEVAGEAGIDRDRVRRRGARQEAARRLDRAHRRRAPDPLRATRRVAALDERLQALEREPPGGAALGAHQGVDLVDDQEPRVRERRAESLAREQDETTTRRGDQNVWGPARHRLPLCGQRVAGAHRHRRRASTPPAQDTVPPTEAVARACTRLPSRPVMWRVDLNHLPRCGRAEDFCRPPQRRQFQAGIGGICGSPLRHRPASCAPPPAAARPETAAGRENVRQKRLVPAHRVFAPTPCLPGSRLISRPRTGIPRRAAAMPAPSFPAQSSRGAGCALVRWRSGALFFERLPLFCNPPQSRARTRFIQLGFNSPPGKNIRHRRTVRELQLGRVQRKRRRVRTAILICGMMRRRAFGLRLQRQFVDAVLRGLRQNIEPRFHFRAVPGNPASSSASVSFIGPGPGCRANNAPRVFNFRHKSPSIPTPRAPQSSWAVCQVPSENDSALRTTHAALGQRLRQRLQRARLPTKSADHVCRFVSRVEPRLQHRVCVR